MGSFRQLTILSLANILTFIPRPHCFPSAIYGAETTRGPPEVNEAADVVQDACAIHNAAQLFEAVMAFARSRQWMASIDGLSDKQGLRLVADVASEAMLECLPSPAKNIWKKGRHFRVQNLSR